MTIPVVKNIDSLLTIVTGRFAATHNGFEREITSFALEPNDVRHGSVFFGFCQNDFERNCFNGLFNDTTKFVPYALSRGASYCIISREQYELRLQELNYYSSFIILVEDAIAAIQKLAAAVFAHHSFPVIAVTGSAGKSTTKELIATILNEANYSTLTSAGNQNNGLGVPLTILRLLDIPPVDFGVVEMGMSTPDNEIRRLCSICPPHIAVILNVLPVHLEYLGSIQRIAAAKAEILESLPSDGWAVLNGDDSLVREMRPQCAKILYFGLSQHADIRAEELTLGFCKATFSLVTPTYKKQVTIDIGGSFNISNFLAAAAVAYILDINSEKIINAVQKFRPVAQRGNLLRLKDGICVIDDTYNSNAISVMYAVENALRGKIMHRRVVVIFGDMRELGTSALEIHRNLGKAIGRTSVDLMIGIGPLAKITCESFADESNRLGLMFENIAELLIYLATGLEDNDIVLIKASRASQFEKIVSGLVTIHSK